MQTLLTTPLVRSPLSVAAARSDRHLLQHSKTSFSKQLDHLQSRDDRNAEDTQEQPAHDLSAHHAAAPAKTDPAYENRDDSNDDVAGDTNRSDEDHSDDPEIETDVPPQQTEANPKPASVEHGDTHASSEGAQNEPDISSYVPQSADLVMPEAPVFTSASNDPLLTISQGAAANSSANTSQVPVAQARPDAIPPQTSASTSPAVSDPNIQTQPVTAPANSQSAQPAVAQTDPVGDSDSAADQSRGTGNDQAENAAPAQRNQVNENISELKDSTANRPANQSTIAQTPPDLPQIVTAKETNAQARTHEKSIQAVVGRTADDENSRLAPASARAVQVDANIHLENLTDQTPQQLQTNAASPIVPANHQSAATGAFAHTAHEAAQSLPHAGSHVDDAPATGQITRSLSAMVNQRGGVMNMRLDPPELGLLRVQMTVARGVVTADFHASTQQAQNLLEKNLSALRGTLENQGLTVDRLGVHMMQNHGQQTMSDDPQHSQHGQSSREQHNAAGGESRGRREQARDQTPRHFAGSFSTVLDGFGT